MAPTNANPNVIGTRDRAVFVGGAIDLIRQFFYQTKLKPISKRQFETSEAMRILNIRHVISK
jgi:hypothetical protein